MPHADQWIRPEILDMQTYHVEPAQDMVKLDLMELPTAIEDPALRAQIGEWVAKQPFNRYPDHDATALKEALHQHTDIPQGAFISVGNGSDECIQTILTALARPGAKMLIPEPGFSVFGICARLAQVDVIQVQLRDDFSLDLNAMIKVLKQKKPALTVIVYPNNPTGNLFNPKDIECIIQAAPGLVLIDEAYFPYAQDTFMPKVLHYPNVVVMRTLSKWGFAGLRLGYMVGPRDWIEAFEKVRPIFNVDCITQRLVTELLPHRAYFDNCVQKVLDERNRLALALNKLPGTTVFPSHANFLLMRIPNAASIYARLKQSGILIKCFDGTHPLLHNTLRITVGTSKENTQLLNTLNNILA